MEARDGSKITVRRRSMARIRKRWTSTFSGGRCCCTRDPFRRPLIRALAHQPSSLLARWNRATSLRRRTLSQSAYCEISLPAVRSSHSAFHSPRTFANTGATPSDLNARPFHLVKPHRAIPKLQHYTYMFYGFCRSLVTRATASRCCKRFHPTKIQYNTISIVIFHFLLVTYARVSTLFLSMLLWPKRYKIRFTGDASTLWYLPRCCGKYFSRNV